jgi:glutamate formiminotransferase
VARAVRGASPGGLPGVKALALEVDGQAQVSMNLVDVDRTGVVAAYERVDAEARARGVTPTWSELVGLAPERALDAAGADRVRLRDFGPHRVLEQRVREATGA